MSGSFGTPRRGAPAAATKRPLRLLTIAGSDSGGGAGIQADLKTFAALGAYGMSAVTAVTAQNTRRVSAVHLVPAPVVAEQIDAVFADLGVDGVKVGMLGDAEVVVAVARVLRRYAGVPVVVDPVMVAKSGDPLLADEAIESLGRELLPLATLVTPNLPEAERLLGRRIAASEEAQRQAAAELASAGPAFLVKGGHRPGSPIVDVLAFGSRARSFRHRRLETMATHGTGCTLSSAIAVHLAAGCELGAAVEQAIAYLTAAMAAAPRLGEGHGPVAHFHRMAETDERRAERRRKDGR